MEDVFVHGLLGIVELVVGYRLLVVGYRLLVVGYWYYSETNPQEAYTF